MTSELPFIDVWMQPPLPRFIGHPMFESLRRWGAAKAPDSSSDPASDPSLVDGLIDRTVKALDDAGIARALLCAWWGPHGPLISNDLVFQFVSARPDRFAGVASVDLMRPRAAVVELRRCVNELGFCALRVLPWLWNLPPDDRRYYPLYSECVELDIPFCLQVGHTGPLCPSEPGRPIPYLDHVALDFPELKIVGGHIGYPWTAEMISLATKYPNVYIDTSAYKPSRYPPGFVAFLRGHGRKKVMFGSNFPMIEPAACTAQVDSLGLDDDALRLFARDNALRVFTRLAK